MLAGAAVLVALAVPLVGLFSRVPWDRLGEVAVSADFQEAWWLSLRTCLTATLVTVLLGTPLALWVASLSRGRTFARVLVLLPMTLPPVVAGLALLATFGRFGLLGGVLRAGGIEIGFTTIAVVIAQVFVSLPFFVIAVEAAAHVVDPAPPRALRALGASRAAVLRHALLPALAPALASGTSLAFARALGEFGATLTFAGSLPGTTRTMPLAIYLARESDRDTAYTLAALLIATAVAALFLGAWAARALTASSSPSAEADEAEDPAEDGVPRDAGSLAVRVRRPERGVEASLEVPAGRVLALIGPNGSGKTTVVEEIAGLLADSTAQVEVDGVRVDGARPGTRGVALLTQKPALLPHRTAIENVQLAARLAGEPEPGLAARRALAAAGASRLAGSRPGALSGGQQALVALARALASQPRVLLLDEPFAALDVRAAARARESLAWVLRGRTAVLVTHTLLDVASLADEVVVMGGGRVAERADVERFLEMPASDFGRSFADVTVLHGVVDSSGTSADLAGTPIPLTDRREPGPVDFVIRPEHVRLRSPNRTYDSGEQPFVVGQLVKCVPLGNAVRVELHLPDGQPLCAQVTVLEWSRLAHLRQLEARLDSFAVFDREEGK